MNCVGIYNRAVLKAIQVADIDRSILGGKNIVEASLGNTSLQRHLAAFKAGSYTAAGTGFLAFVAFARGFTVSGTMTSAFTVRRPYWNQAPEKARAVS